MLYLVNYLQKLDFYLLFGNVIAHSPGFEMSAAFTYQLSNITIANSNIIMNTYVQ